nr:uncharacterized protein LOC111512628 [Leptinotarsa decemlineata]
MGGVIVLLAGDFQQTLPVVPKGTRADEVESSIKKSNLWPQVNILELSKNMRAHLGGDASSGRFSDLLKIGNGGFPSFDGTITIPEELCTVVTTVQELLSEVYSDIIHIHYKPIEWLCERAILTTMNDQAAAINDILLMSFEGEEKVYTSIAVNTDDATNHPVEFLNSLKVPSLPCHKLFCMWALQLCCCEI